MLRFENAIKRFRLLTSTGVEVNDCGSPLDFNDLDYDPEEGMEWEHALHQAFYASTFEVVSSEGIEERVDITVQRLDTDEPSFLVHSIRDFGTAKPVDSFPLTLNVSLDAVPTDTGQRALENIILGIFMELLRSAERAASYFSSLKQTKTPALRREVLRALRGIASDGTVDMAGDKYEVYVEAEPMFPKPGEVQRHRYDVYVNRTPENKLVSLVVEDRELTMTVPASSGDSERVSTFVPTDDDLKDSGTVAREILYTFFELSSPSPVGTAASILPG